MLLQFRFKNFKSFKEETILDFTATKITEHSNRVVEIGNEKILPVAAIFGANASGKSNVLEAFRFMMTYVLNSFAYGGTSNEKNSNGNYFKHTPFLFDVESKEEESLFEVYFIDEDNGFKTYNYGFTLNKDGIYEEWLNYKSKTAKIFRNVFYRDKDELDLNGLPKRSQDNLKVALEKEVLVASLGAKLKVTKLKVVRDWFMTNSFANFGNPLENAVLSSILPRNFVDSKQVQKNVVDYFSTFDSSIIDFNVDVMRDDNGQIKHVNINTVHRTKDGGTATIPLNDESAGTLKMFALYPSLHDVLDNGGTLFVDELNSKLHPLLVRNFVITFLNHQTNPKHAQLVFTTHDSWQLSNNLLRRDEIWFTAKDDDGVSNLYSLADFVDDDGTKIRKDENYEKNYLLGKYGAIPNLQAMDLFKED